MSKPRLKTTPDLAASSVKHQEAITLGKEHFSAWQYNVADHFKDKSVQEIKDILRATANPFAVCIENVIGDFNLGTILRNANALNAREVFYIGQKKTDRRSMVGVQNYTPITWLSSLDELIKLKERYVFVACDNVDGAVSISSYRFVPNTLLFIGEEGVGLTQQTLNLCQDTVYIPQQGSVRSFNAGVASGIIMYEYLRQLQKL